MADSLRISLQPGAPDLSDLPWDRPLDLWPLHCSRLVELPRGISRHPVLFVNYDSELFALKEMRAGAAEKEFEMLVKMAENHLPAVAPIGYACTDIQNVENSVLITRYLENSLPFRLLFMSPGLERYREHLLDAISGLLVQLHLTGFYWGDCSLSNTLFRRDAGALQAYLVDAETGELHLDYFDPALRFHDLQIMAENLNSELMELHTKGTLFGVPVPISDAGNYVQQRYQSLWEEITHEDIIGAGEHFLIHERIRVLNSLGFSIGNVELAELENGSQLRLRVIVTDRNFHRDQLYNLTGLDVEEMQARQMMNEIQEMRATQSQVENRSMPLGAAAFHWLENIYHPVVEQLSPLANQNMTVAELYCQVLEHKWYLSERERRDVGHQTATEDYLRQSQSMKGTELSR